MVGIQPSPSLSTYVALGLERPEVKATAFAPGEELARAEASAGVRVGVRGARSGEEEEREVGEGYHCERLMGGCVAVRKADGEEW